ncbi:MAG: hypothetical protein K2L88_03525, partial [Clostridiales bacterium]|nr:hypothetical protein [Clostridiales bacterium]
LPHVTVCQFVILRVAYLSRCVFLFGCGLHDFLGLRTYYSPDLINMQTNEGALSAYSKKIF